MVCWEYVICRRFPTFFLSLFLVSDIFFPYRRVFFGHISITCIIELVFTDIIAGIPAKRKLRVAAFIFYFMFTTFRNFEYVGRRKRK